MGTSYAPAQYVPSGGAATAALLAALPPVAPLGPVEMTPAGDLVHSRRRLTREQMAAMAAAAGWTEDLAWRRARRDAFGTVF